MGTLIFMRGSMSATMGGKGGEEGGVGWNKNKPADIFHQTVTLQGKAQAIIMSCTLFIKDASGQGLQ